MAGIGWAGDNDPYNLDSFTIWRIRMDFSLATIDPRAHVIPIAITSAEFDLVDPFELPPGVNGDDRWRGYHSS